jgi:hypothetical protein
MRNDWEDHVRGRPARVSAARTRGTGDHHKRMLGMRASRASRAAELQPVPRRVCEPRIIAMCREQGVVPAGVRLCCDDFDPDIGRRLAT